MISQIPGAAEGLEQLVCDGKTLWGSAIEQNDSNHRFVAQVTVYARALGVALVQETCDTHGSSEKAAPGTWSSSPPPDRGRGRVRWLATGSSPAC